jgi:steroid 5-alpha reductase family enzyme
MPAALITTFAWSALFLFIYVSSWFICSLVLKRNDVADVAWGLGPTMLVWWLALQPGAHNPLIWPVAVLVTIWGVRLAYHIGRRDFSHGRGEDPRYAAWRAEWKFFTLRSYLQVFLLQGFFMLLVSTPLIVLAASSASRGIAAGIVGALVWGVGFFFESTADRQLAGFLSQPRETRCPVMDRGLWAWSRHPNYFGESLMWWGLAIMALGVDWGWIGLLSPITITTLLVFVSGIPLAEQRHAGEPEWEAYKARTSAFIPLPPRRQ